MTRFILFCLPCFICFIAAAILAGLGKDGLGWFLLVGALAMPTNFQTIIKTGSESTDA